MDASSSSKRERAPSGGKRSTPSPLDKLTQKFKIKASSRSTRNDGQRAPQSPRNQPKLEDCQFSWSLTAANDVRGSLPLPSGGSMRDRKAPRLSLGEDYGSSRLRPSPNSSYDILMAAAQKSPDGRLILPKHSPRSSLSSPRSSLGVQENLDGMQHCNINDQTESGMEDILVSPPPNHNNNSYENNGNAVLSPIQSHENLTSPLSPLSPQSIHHLSPQSIHHLSPQSNNSNSPSSIHSKEVLPNFKEFLQSVSQEVPPTSPQGALRQSQDALSPQNSNPRRLTSPSSSDLGMPMGANGSVPSLTAKFINFGLSTVPVTGPPHSPLHPRDYSPRMEANPNPNAPYQGTNYIASGFSSYPAPSPRDYSPRIPSDQPAFSPRTEQQFAQMSLGSPITSPNYPRVAGDTFSSADYVASKETYFPVNSSPRNNHNSPRNFENNFDHTMILSPNVPSYPPSHQRPPCS